MVEFLTKKFLSAEAHDISGVEKINFTATKIFAKSPQIEKDLIKSTARHNLDYCPVSPNLSRFVAILRKFWFARKINLSPGNVVGGRHLHPAFFVIEIRTVRRSLTHGGRPYGDCGTITQYHHK
jgi:hypothetical protein